MEVTPVIDFYIVFPTCPEDHVEKWKQDIEQLKNDLLYQLSTEFLARFEARAVAFAIKSRQESTGIRLAVCSSIHFSSIQQALNCWLLSAKPEFQQTFKALFQNTALRSWEFRCHFDANQIQSVLASQNQPSIAGTLSEAPIPWSQMNQTGQPGQTGLLNSSSQANSNIPALMNPANLSSQSNFSRADSAAKKRVLFQDEYLKLSPDSQHGYIKRVCSIQLAKVFDLKNLSYGKLNTLRGRVAVYSSLFKPEIRFYIDISTLVRSVMLCCYTAVTEEKLDLKLEIQLDLHLSSQALQTSLFTTEFKLDTQTQQSRNKHYQVFLTPGFVHLRENNFHEFELKPEPSLHFICFGYCDPFLPNAYTFWSFFANHVTACALQLSPGASSGCPASGLLDLKTCLRCLKLWMDCTVKNDKKRPISSSADKLILFFSEHMKRFVNFYRWELSESACLLYTCILLKANKMSENELKKFVEKSDFPSLNIVMKALATTDEKHARILTRAVNSNSSGFVALLKKVKFFESWNSDSHIETAFRSFLTLLESKSTFFEDLFEDPKVTGSLDLGTRIELYHRAGRELEPEKLLSDIKSRSDIPAMLSVVANLTSNVSVQSELNRSLQKKWLELLFADAENDNSLKLGVNEWQNLTDFMENNQMPVEMRKEVFKSVKSSCLRTLTVDSQAKLSDGFQTNVLAFLTDCRFITDPDEAVALLSGMFELKTSGRLMTLVAEHLSSLKIVELAIQTPGKQALNDVFFKALALLEPKARQDKDNKGSIIVTVQKQIEQVKETNSQQVDDYRRLWLEALRRNLEEKPHLTKTDLELIWKDLEQAGDESLVDVFYKCCSYHLSTEENGKQVGNFLISVDLLFRDQLSSAYQLQQEVFIFLVTKKLAQHSNQPEDRALALLQHPFAWRWLANVEHSDCIKATLRGQSIQFLRDWIEKLEGMELSESQFEALVKKFNSKEKCKELDDFINACKLPCKHLTSHLISLMKETLSRYNDDKTITSQVLKWLSSLSCDIDDLPGYEERFKIVQRVVEDQIHKMRETSILDYVFQSFSIVARNLCDLLESTIFSEIYKSDLYRGPKTRVSEVFYVLRRAVQTYKQFLIEDISEKRVSEVSGKFCTDTNLEVEQRLAMEFLQMDSPVLKEDLVDSLKHVKTWKTRSEMFLHQRFKSLLRDSDLIVFQYFLDHCGPSVLVRKFNDAANALKKMCNSVIENHWNVLQSLYSNMPLFTFLIAQVNSDFQQLFDAANDEDSEEVSFAHINALIKIQEMSRMLVHKISTGEGMLRAKTTMEELAMALNIGLNGSSENVSDDRAKDAIDCIEICSSNLRAIQGLHDSLSSRGDSSRKQALTLVQCKNEGELRFSICISDGEATCELINQPVDDHWSLEKLIEQRCRVLMILSSSYSLVDDTDRQNLKDFVGTVDSLEKVFQQQSKLRSVGHPLYSETDISGQAEELETLESKNRRYLEVWESVLQEARQKKPLLLYVFGANLLRLHRFFIGDGSQAAEVATILRFMNLNGRNLLLRNESPHLTFDVDRVRNLQPVQQKPNLLNQLLAIADRLSGLSLLGDRQLACGQQQPRSPSCIQRGRLIVVRVDPDREPHSVRAFVTVWRNSQEFAPQPSEVLFCSKDSAEEEISLLLLRCAHNGDRAHYIVCAELLSQRLLNHLASGILSLCDANRLGRLAVFCRAPVTHRLLAIFRDNQLQPTLDSDAQLSVALGAICGDSVTLVRSERAGCGKTEMVRSLAAQSHMIMRSVHVSGQFSKVELMSQLSGLGSEDLLHLDIGWIDDVGGFETTLFEALLTGMLCHSSGLLNFKPGRVVIELANSANDELADQFVLFNHLPFRQVLQLRWQTLDDLVVSPEPRSPVQMVAKYQQALEARSLDKREVSLDTVLDPIDCRQLLKRVLTPLDQQSYLTSMATLRVLADQLKKLSSSAFFKVSGVEQAFGRDASPTIRSDLVRFLFTSIRRLMNRSVGPAKAKQSLSKLGRHQQKVEDSSVQRLNDFLSWESFDYLAPVFQKQEIAAVELVYRRLIDVPDEIRRLFERNMRVGKLTDYAEMGQAKLLEKLLRIAGRNGPGHRPRELDHDEEDGAGGVYALTADNFLKMVLISLRIDCDVPVLIIGETGCGKTSLIRFLSKVHEAKLHVLNFHAGTTQQRIVEETDKAVKEAKELIRKDRGSKRRDTRTVWMFLDEINTCDHLGMLKELICHRRLLGRPLPQNLRFLAASNPYRLRDPEAALTAGFRLAEREHDKMRHLVYRVNPLPESILDLVWDFGRLQDADEVEYIKRMLRDQLRVRAQHLLDRLTRAVWQSQQFIRKLEKTEYAISLRDVRRCCEFITFFFWFYELRDKNSQDREAILSREQLALMMSLYVCYYVRIRSAKMRTQYARDILTQLTGAESNEELIRMEQKDILERMELPDNVARNSALLENVFVLLCCVYNKVPVFLVGKPGCSKSLAVSLLRSNLRGRDSKDPFFKALPALRFFCYQGSEASTSEGIEKVFKRATNKAGEDSGGDEYRYVVLLDEIGLAEKSRHNPLKVLHSLLEPEDSEFTCKARVAVLGLSNWALDPAKMNRAVHISRPDMTAEELLVTGRAIVLEGDPKGEGGAAIGGRIDEGDMQQIAHACEGYFSKQPKEDFHGLRDYYYLVKYLAKENVRMQSNKLAILSQGLVRNFSGLDEPHFMDHFAKHYGDLETAYRDVLHQRDKVSVIMESLEDKSARHLMLITDTDRDLDLLAHVLTEKNRPFRVLHGSSYERDQLSEQFALRKLHEVMMCMENGIVVVFKDFELVYGSLYDMLNQNYSVYNQRRYCRVAMGTQANKNCSVDDKFRCVVLVRADTLERVDRAFLNRFEKQTFGFGDVLSEQQKHAVDDLRNSFVDKTTSITGLNWQADKRLEFAEHETFSGFHPELPGAHLLTAMSSSSLDVTAEQLPKLLLSQAFPDAVLRLSYSPLPPDYRQSLQEAYFQTLSDVTLASYVAKRLAEGGGKPSGTVVYTRTRMEDSSWRARLGVKCSVLRLVDFMGEDELRDELSTALRDTAGGVVALSCRPSVDSEAAPQLRWLLESLMEGAASGGPVVLLWIFHLGGSEGTVGGRQTWQWSPLLRSWRLLCLETLGDGSAGGSAELLRRLVSSSSAQHILADCPEPVRLRVRSLLQDALFECLEAGPRRDSAVRLLLDNPEVANALVEAAIGHAAQDEEDANVEKFSPEHWMVGLARESAQLARFATLAEFAVSRLADRVADRLLDLLRLLRDARAFELEFSTPTGPFDARTLGCLLRGLRRLARTRRGRPIDLSDVTLVGLRYPLSGFAFADLRDAAADAAAAAESDGQDREEAAAEAALAALQPWLKELELTGEEAASEAAELLAADLMAQVTAEIAPGADLSAQLRQLLIALPPLASVQSAGSRWAPVVSAFALADSMATPLRLWSILASACPELNLPELLQSDEDHGGEPDRRELPQLLMQAMLPSEANLSRLGMSDSVAKWDRMVAKALLVLGDSEAAQLAVTEQLSMCRLFTSTLLLPLNLPAVLLHRVQDFLTDEPDSLFSESGVRRINALLLESLPDLQGVAVVQDQLQQQLQCLWSLYLHQAIQRGALSPGLVDAFLVKLSERQLPLGSFALLWGAALDNSPASCSFRPAVEAWVEQQLRGHGQGSSELARLVSALMPDEFRSSSSSSSGGPAAEHPDEESLRDIASGLSLQRLARLRGFSATASRAFAVTDEDDQGRCRRLILTEAGQRLTTQLLRDCPAIKPGHALAVALAQAALPLAPLPRVLDCLATELRLSLPALRLPFLPLPADHSHPDAFGDVAGPHKAACAALDALLRCPGDSRLLEQLAPSASSAPAAAAAWIERVFLHSSKQGSRLTEAETQAGAAMHRRLLSLQESESVGPHPSLLNWLFLGSCLGSEPALERTAVGGEDWLSHLAASLAASGTAALLGRQFSVRSAASMAARSDCGEVARELRKLLDAKTSLTKGLLATRCHRCLSVTVVLEDSRAPLPDACCLCGAHGPQEAVAASSSDTCDSLPTQLLRWAVGAVTAVLCLCAGGPSAASALGSELLGRPAATLSDILADACAEMRTALGMDWDEPGWICHMLLADACHQFTASPCSLFASSLLRSTALTLASRRSRVAQFKAARLTERNCSGAEAANLRAAAQLDGALPPDPPSVPGELLRPRVRVTWELTGHLRTLACGRQLAGGGASATAGAADLVRAVMAFQTPLKQMAELAQVLPWHRQCVSLLDAKIPKAAWQDLSVNAVIRKHPEAAALWPAALASLRSLGLADCGPESRVCKTLLAEGSWLTELAQCHICPGVNRFLVTAAGIALRGGSGLGHLLTGAQSVTLPCRRLTHAAPAFVALSLTELDRLAATFSGAKDPRLSDATHYVDWGLLDTALGHLATVGKCWALADAWKPRFSDYPQRDLAALMTRFRSDATAAAAEAGELGLESLSQAEAAKLKELQEQDHTYARQLTDCVSSILRYLCDQAWPSCDLLAMPLGQFAADCSDQLLVRWQLPDPLPDPEPGRLTLAKLLSLAQLALCQQFLLVRHELARRSYSAAIDASLLDSLAEPFATRDALRSALAACQVACVLHLLDEGHSTEGSLKHLLEPAGIWPESGQGIRQQLLESLPSEATVMYLYPLCELLLKLDEEKIDTAEKFQRKLREGDI